MHFPDPHSAQPDTLIDEVHRHRQQRAMSHAQMQAAADALEAMMRQLLLVSDAVARALR